MLRAEGHDVSVASNGREALEAIERESFDLVLMDVQMREMDGHQASVAIRERELLHGGRLSIIAMTAHVTVRDREECLAAGMDDFLSKPVRKGELRQAIARATGTAWTA